MLDSPLILVVDDNPTNLKLVTEVLEYEGYRVLKASDAESALIMINNSTPQLILMDLGLPGMDGLTLTQKLKSDPATKQIIIVSLTAFAMKSDEARAMEAGSDGYITKPFDTRKLPIQIAEYLLKVPNSLN